MLFLSFIAVTNKLLIKLIVIATDSEKFQRKINHKRCKILDVSVLQTFTGRFFNKTMDCAGINLHPSLSKPKSVDPNPV